MSDETKATEVESGSQGAQRRGFDPPSFPAVAATRPVAVHAFPSGGYVWDVAAAEQVRLEHGIVGTMAGGLPGFALQNKVKGLPLLLSLEELAAAATMGVARLQASENMGERGTEECGGLHRMAASSCSHPCLLASTCPHQPPCSVPHTLHAAREASFSEKFRLPVTEGDVEVAAEWFGASGRGVQRQRDGSDAPAGIGGCSESAAVDCSEEEVAGGEEKGNGGEDRNQSRGRCKGAKDIGREWHDDDREGVSNGTSATSPSTCCNHHPPSSSSLPLTQPHARTSLLSMLASLLNSSSATMRLRCLVYADLLARSCRMTCGMRFGAHWLVYPGGADPCDLHAPCMLRVQRQHEGFSAQQLLAAARVAMVSRKRLVLATAPEEVLQGEGFWERFVERYGVVQVERRDGEEGERLVRGVLEDGLGGAELEGLAQVGDDAGAKHEEVARLILKDGRGSEQGGGEAGERGAAESRGMCGGEQGWEKQERKGGASVRGEEWVEYTTVVTDLDFLPLELRTQNPLKAKMLQQGQQVGTRRSRKSGAV
ncbi:unnamed protein product [Closterium sp. Naga37s-1]|nr:unnamed protein product [Closterium sp. Naga37s-1]